MKYLSWEEPIEGIDKHGNSVTCTRTVYMTEDDAAMVSRRIYQLYKLDYSHLSHDHLVTDAIVNNWADRVDVERLP